MNIIVVGCGTLGSNLTKRFYEQGYEVSVVTNNPSDFEDLSNLNILTVIGNASDEDVLIKAGIENCDAIVVVTRNDNINLMVSQMAKKIFSVDYIIARVYEPSRRELFREIGIQTISPNSMALETINDKIIYGMDVISNKLGKNQVITKFIDINQEYNGKYIYECKFLKDEFIYGIIKASNEQFHFYNHDNKKNTIYILQNGDKIVINKIAR